MNLRGKKCTWSGCDKAAQVSHPKGALCLEHWARFVDEEWDEYQQLKTKTGTPPAEADCAKAVE